MLCWNNRPLLKQSNFVAETADFIAEKADSVAETVDLVAETTSKHANSVTRNLRFWKSISWNNGSNMKTWLHGLF